MDRGCCSATGMCIAAALPISACPIAPRLGFVHDRPFPGPSMQLPCPGRGISAASFCAVPPSPHTAPRHHCARFMLMSAWPISFL